jgi:hypothetical protein
MLRTPIIVLAFVACAVSAFGTQWQVGPGQLYTMPSQVAVLVADGDTVNIAAGPYPSDVTNWTADDLLLRGIGGMAHLESNGNAWGGKGIWVIQGDRTTVENIEFSECSVPDEKWRWHPAGRAPPHRSALLFPRQRKWDPCRGCIAEHDPH